MAKTERVHFISIGGSVMHNLALALQKKGVHVSGSDDEIFEPSRSKLEKAGLLPAAMGWDENNISKDLDAVILGMHAKADNPELAKARELNIPVFSFPEYIRNQCDDKQRVVITGSHGKTTITGIIIHILKAVNKEFDYIIGGATQDTELTVQLTDAPLIIVEGDEYLTSTLDQVSKFHKYHHHIALISGISWDHMNVFPTFDDYVKQFEIMADNTPKGGCIVYYDDDYLVHSIATKDRADVKPIPYNTHPYEIKEGKTYLKTADGLLEVQLFGDHNMQNIAGALAVCQRLGVSTEQFYAHIGTFKGVARRMQQIAATDTQLIIQDFAHAPSKVEATTAALKDQYPSQKLLAVLELHTFSSLNKDFLPHYEHKLDKADIPLVFIEPNTLAHKNLPEISESEIKEFFKNKNIRLFNQASELREFILENTDRNTHVLFMSSGNFGGLDLKELSIKITNPS